MTGENQERIINEDKYTKLIEEKAKLLSIIGESENEEEIIEELKKRVQKLDDELREHTESQTFASEKEKLRKEREKWQKE